MKYDEYKELYNSLRTADDVERLSSEYDPRMLDSLFTQKTTREVKKRFYVVKQNSGKMLKEWRKGTSIMGLSKKYKFPPILTAMFIFLAALKGVPQDLYEAAAIDGAGKWRQFFSITIPLITPVIFYNLVTQLCSAFQEFNSAYIITQGGPLGSTTLISLLVYQNAFKSYEMGLACAMAWLLFLIVAVFSLVAFLSQKYWVYYSDDER